MRGPSSQCCPRVNCPPHDPSTGMSDDLPDGGVVPVVHSRPLSSLAPGASHRSSDSVPSSIRNRRLSGHPYRTDPDEFRVPVPAQHGRVSVDGLPAASPTGCELPLRGGSPGRTSGTCFRSRSDPAPEGRPSSRSSKRASSDRRVCDHPEPKRIVTNRFRHVPDRVLSTRTY